MRLLIALILSSSYSYSVGELPSWQKRHAEGWAWYHDFKNSEEEPEEKQETSKDPREILKQAREDLERALARALLDPSEENVFAYMVLQKEWVDKSKNLSKTWMKNILKHPEIGVQSPTTQYGIQVRKEVDSLRRKNIIQEISKNYILVFFYEGKNLFSQEFSKVVTLFLKRHPWIIRPIAVDGVVLQNFPKSLQDASFANDMKVSIFPSLFLVDMFSKKAIPIAFGMATVGQIEDNILTQFGDIE